jgi:hypothetical protein
MKMKSRKNGDSMHPKEPKLHPTRGIGGIFIEALMIVLSILLALGLENWNEHRKEERRCREALLLIRDEIVQNRQELADLIESHRAKCSELMQASKNLGRGGKVTIQANAAFASHNSTAFDVAMNGRVLNTLNYRTLLPVTESYAYHAWLKKLEETYFQLLLQVNPEENPKKVSRDLLLITGVLRNYADLEAEAVKQYGLALTAIDRALAE